MNRHERGFSLVELIVVIAIVSVVLAVAFSMFLFGNRSEKIIQVQVDERTSFRLMMNALEKEIANGSGFMLLTTASSEAGYTQFYVTTVDGQGTLMRQNDTAAEAPLVGSGYAVKGLSVTFSLSTADSRTVHVKLLAGSGYFVEKDILVQNLPVSVTHATAPDSQAILKIKKM